MGRIKPGAPPIVQPGRLATLATHTDPLPQALVLTAIVISFAMTAVMLVIALRAHAQTGTDHVDGIEPTGAEDGDTVTEAAAVDAGQGASR
jgi:multicomponent K+:H+ antiporter subunit C